MSEQDYYDWSQDTIAALEAQVADLKAQLAAWHEAMTDVSVITWTLSEENADDLQKQLRAVIAQTIREITNPVVSEQAAQLAAATERETALAEGLLLGCRGCAEQDPLAPNHMLSTNRIHRSGWICPYNDDIRAVLAAYRDAHPDAAGPA